MNSENINVLWVESRSYLPDYILPKHTHTFFHYLYVVGGSGSIRIKNTEYKLTPNNLYLVTPDTDHTFCASSTSRLVTLEIKFEINDKALCDEVCAFPAVINCSNTSVYEILNRLHNERITKKIYYKELSSCILYEVFIKLKRTVSNLGKRFVGGSESEGEQALDDISKIKIYIKNNIDNDITLTELAEIANLEKTYFVKKFKKATGMTPMQYVRDMKLTRAKKFLLYSDMNITQISEAMSFSSIHRFSEFFLKETGMSPQQFRKNEDIT